MLSEDYCDKCGCFWNNEGNQADRKCEICGNTLKSVPNKYYEDFQGILFVSDTMKQKLIEDLVKTSPNFDQYYFDNAINIKGQRDEAFNSKMAHGKAVLSEASRAPKCPTCQSTNIHRISTTSKVVNTALWGIFGTKRHKTFHCNSCSYEW